MSFLKEKLAEIERRRVREVRARRDHFTISLVGYTNAGKSTLMNALTGASAFVEDRLFATLDTLTRRWNLGNGRHALLSDTVGFIRNLPHHLVASFRATLEETIHADLLLHVVDASNPDSLEQIAAVQEVLQALGVADRPTLLLLNKLDAVDDEAVLAVLRGRFPDALAISARDGRGLAELTAAVNELMRGEERQVRLSVPVRDGRTLGLLERLGHVLETRYDDGRAIVDVRIAPRALEYVHSLAADVRHLEPQN
jgi:GTP-binding protein HflX